MKKIILSMFAIASLVPQMVFAKGENVDDYNMVAGNVKYYKTVYDSQEMFPFSTRNNNSSHHTVEISKKEYDLASTNSTTYGAGATNTEYKRLTTNIYNNGNNYRYTATLDWKTMPATRSYDVIAIGHLSNVKYNSNLNFSQYYCTTDGNCRTLTTHYPKISSTGCGAAFKVPTGSLSVLSQTISFNVTKNTSGVISSQSSYGDYSHATSNVSSSQAQNYNIGTSGISFYNGVGGYYDNIMPAVATWNGSW